jgi:DNA-binding transcriptional MerR regulator
MQTFTIRDIENLTGIKAHTIRIWEQRYNFFTPKRKESQHRYYDNEDLKMMMRIAFLYHNGWKVSKIAKLSQEQITEVVRNTALKAGEYKNYVNKMIEAALDFNEDAFVETMEAVISKTGFEKCIVEVCYPYLLKLGLLWSTNNVIPAQEHFSSYIIQNKIIAETDKLTPRVRKPEIMLICPDGEFHELPLLFINYLLRKNGWSTVYLGTNIKTNEVVQVAALPDIKFLYIHLITNFTGLELDDYFENICRTFPDKMIYVSGEGLKVMQRKFTNLRLLLSDQAIYDFIGRVEEY